MLHDVGELLPHLRAGPPPNRNTPAASTACSSAPACRGPALAGGGYLFDNVSITPSNGPGPPGCDVPIEKEADQTHGARRWPRGLPDHGPQPRPSRRPQPPGLRSHPASDDLRECRPQAASHRPPALPRDPALAAPPTRQLPPRAPGRCQRAAGHAHEHRRHHAASACRPRRRPARGAPASPGAARGYRDAQTHRESQGHREDRQARAGSARPSTSTAAVYRITAIAGPLGSERPSLHVSLASGATPGERVRRRCTRFGRRPPRQRRSSTLRLPPRRHLGRGGSLPEARRASWRPRRAESGRPTAR